MEQISNKLYLCRKGKLLSDDPEEEAKQRAFTALINKLTIDNFDKIVANMAKIEVLDAKTLKGFVTNIFNKALTESIFCEMYANLCKELTHCMPRFVSQSRQDVSPTAFFRVAFLCAAYCSFTGSNHLLLAESIRVLRICGYVGRSNRLVATKHLCCFPSFRWGATYDEQSQSWKGVVCQPFRISARACI